MTRTAIKRELNNGKKVTHRHFDKGEYIELVNDKIRFSDGHTTTQEFFWGIHDEVIWAANWEIV